jgi:hypothetical protein
MAREQARYVGYLQPEGGGGVVQKSRGLPFPLGVLICDAAFSRAKYEFRIRI